MAYEDVREGLHPDFVGDQNIFQGFSNNINPNKIKESFRWVEYLWHRLGMVRQALHKTVAYFMTEADVTGAGPSRNDEWRELLNDKMDILNILKSLGIDYCTYGNSVSSIVFPIRRYLVCPRKDCNLTVRIERINFSFHEGEFHARCPDCGFEGKMNVYDRKVFNSDNIHVLKWNLHEIDIEYSQYTGDERLLWEPPKEWKKKIDSGNRTVLTNTPLSMLKAASEDKELLLNPTYVHHIKFPGLSGTDTSGWGIPPLLSCFSDVYYYQLLRKFQEGVAMDFLFPIRTLSPARPQGDPASGADPLMSGGQDGMPMIVDQIEQLVDEHRQDPLTWHTTPFPIQEGTLGGQGVKLIRPDLLTHGANEILNSMGIPVEFYRGNLKWRSGGPEAIRLMEKNWEHLPSALETWLDWMTSVVARARGWEPIKSSLKPPSMFDDPVRRQIMLQLAAQGQISTKTALRPWDIDLEQEQKNMSAERKQMQKTQEDMEAEELTSIPNLAALSQGMQGAPQGPGVGGGMPPQSVGMPATMGGNSPMTVSDMDSQAEQIAMQMLNMPHYERDSMLSNLKSENQTLHSVVMGKMESARQQVDREGAQMARQQQFGAV